MDYPFGSAIKKHLQVFVENERPNMPVQKGNDQIFKTLGRYFPT